MLALQTAALLLPCAVSHFSFRNACEDSRYLFGSENMMHRIVLSY